jgi:hypothetical protein
MRKHVHGIRWGFLRIRGWNEYLFVVENKILNIFSLMACKNTITGQEDLIVFIERVYLHCGILKSIID